MKRCGFAPDQDYGPKGSVFAPFFSVQQAATTNGTYVLSRLSGAKMLTISMVRKADRRGYSLHISDVASDYPGEDKQDAASYINKVIEKEILRAPEQYRGFTAALKPVRWAKLRSIKPSALRRFQNGPGCVNVRDHIFFVVSEGVRCVR